MRRAWWFLLLLSNGVCVKKGNYEWTCEEVILDSSLILANSSSDSCNIPMFQSQKARWDDRAKLKSLNVWRSISLYVQQPEIEHEAGVQKASSEFGAEPLIYLTPQHLQRTMNLMRKLLRLYGPERIVVSFNGGKDATVTMSLYCAAMASLYIDSRPRAVWFKRSDEFDIVEKFVDEQTEYWDLDLTIVEGEWKDNIDCVVRMMGVDPHVLFLLGVRSDDDPKATTIALSSGTKEVFMRAHPLLDWSYGMIWDYFALTKTPYCELYDMGYSSLGRLTDSSRNDQLEILESGRYRKASELPEEDWPTERQGRQHPAP